jgi:hypothetical protein
MDGDLTTFSSLELATLREVWVRVAEDFAPFDVNVTTDLGQYAAEGGVRVAIGGSWTDWYEDLQLKLGISAPDAATGVQLDSPSGANPDTVWVFATSILPNPATATPHDLAEAIAYVADVASHETGHHYGLAHQSVFDANGNMADEYRDGDGIRGPIMGNSFGDPRSLWAYGTVQGFEFVQTRIGTMPVPAVVMQDDIATLADRLGYREDEDGTSFSTARSLPDNRLNFVLDSDTDRYSTHGVIAQTSDRDYFSFTVPTLSDVSLQVDVAAMGANLDARIELWTANTATTSSGITTTTSRMLAASAPTSSLGASLFERLQPGTYYVVVASAGNYGDVGQYALSAVVRDVDPNSLEHGGRFVSGAKRKSEVLNVTSSDDQLAASLPPFRDDARDRHQSQAPLDTREMRDVVFRNFADYDRFANDLLRDGDVGGLVKSDTVPELEMPIGSPNADQLVKALHPARKFRSSGR